MMMMSSSLSKQFTCINQLLRIHGNICLLPCASFARKVKAEKPPKRIKVWPNDWLPFEWDYPEKEIGYFATGDPDEKVYEMADLNNVYKPGFEFLKDRDDVPESVKKLFKLNNSYRVEISNYVRERRNRQYQRHPFDVESHEVMIANYTSRIRSVKEHIRLVPNDAVAKITVNYYRHKRQTFLNQLYRMDAQRYEVLIKNLNIEHKIGFPGEITHPKIERIPTLTRLTQEYCDNIKKRKLEEYHEKLKSQQQSFMKESEETKKWIDQEMKKYSISEEDLITGFKPVPKYRDPPPVRPLVEDHESQQEQQQQ